MKKHCFTLSPPMPSLNEEEKPVNKTAMRQKPAKRRNWQKPFFNTLEFGKENLIPLTHKLAGAILV